MAYRISACGRHNPTGIPAIEARFSVLDRLIQDVEAFETEATRWRATRTATITARDRLRVEIWHPLLRHITAIAAVAGESVTGLTGRFTLPPFRIGELEFAIAGRRIANEAILEHETLRPYGLMQGAAVELLTQLGVWKALDRKAVECRLRHVGARAGLKARTDEMMQEITLLGILYRSEFRSDPARLAAWRSARKVAWPAHKRAGSNREAAVSGTAAGRPG
ncbi:MAG: hypothetical protein ABI587_06940 [Gemmatimonadales bacterium]